MTRELPLGWEWIRLGDLGIEVRGQVKPEPGVTYDLYSVPAFPTRRPERVDGASIKSGKRSVQEDDVLLCKINPRINRVWVVGGADGFPQIASTEYLILRLHDPQMAPAIKWYLSSPRFRDWIKLSVEGATGSHTRAKSCPILDQEIPLPPADEQTRIVVAIEEHFSHLDAVQANIENVDAKLTALSLSTIGNLFSNRWPSYKIGEVAQVGSGATPNRSELRYWSGGTIPWVTSGALNARSISHANEYITSEALEETSVRVWPVGTILLAMYGEGKTRGKASQLQIEATCNQACGAINYDRSRVNGDYLLSFLNSQYEKSRQLASGGVQPNLSLGLIKKMEVPLPDLETQRSLALHAEEIIQQTSTLSESCSATQQNIQALRRSVLAEAFSGRLVAQDPNDESASALLGRIHAPHVPKGN